MMPNPVATLLVGLVTLISNVSAAAGAEIVRSTYTVYSGNGTFSEEQGSRAILRGRVGRGDADKLKKFLDEHGPVIDTVVLQSPGGHVIEAMRIGKIIRDRFLGTIAPHRDAANQPACDEEPARGKHNCTCASDCFFIFVGGIQRSGDYLVIRQPRFGSEYFAGLSAANAKERQETLLGEVRGYLDKMEVPTAFFSKMTSVPSNEARLLEPAESQELQDVVPSVREWLEAKCGKVLAIREANTIEALKCAHAALLEARREAWQEHSSSD